MPTAGTRRLSRPRPHRRRRGRAHALPPRARRLRLPVLQPDPEPDRARERRARHRDRRRIRWRPRRRSRWSASASGSTTSRRSSRAASSSASRSRAPSPSGPTCCCATSRPARSTSRPASLVLEALERVNRELGTDDRGHHAQRRRSPAMADRVITLADGRIAERRRNAAQRRAAGARAGEAHARARPQAPPRPLARCKRPGRWRSRWCSPAGVAMFVTCAATYDSLARTRATPTTTRYRFADVFAHAQARARCARARASQRSPASPRSRRASSRDVTLDVPRTWREPVTRPPGLAARRRRAAARTTLYLRAGRCVEPARDDEVLVERGVRRRAPPRARRSRAGGDQRPAGASSRIVGIALSPEYVYAIRRRRASSPTTQRFGVALDGARRALARGVRHGRRVQRRRRSRLAAGRLASRRDRRGSTACSRRTAARRVSAATSRLSNCIARRRARAAAHAWRCHRAGDLPRRRGVPAQRRAVAPGVAAARADRGAQGARLLERASRLALPQVGPRDRGARRRCSASALGALVGRGMTSSSTRSSSASRSCDFHLPGRSSSPAGRRASARRPRCGALGAVRRAVALPPAEAMRPRAAGPRTGRAGRARGPAPRALGARRAHDAAQPRAAALRAPRCRRSASPSRSRSLFVGIVQIDVDEPARRHAVRHRCSARTRR